GVVAPPPFDRLGGVVDDPVLRNTMLLVFRPFLHPIVTRGTRRDGLDREDQVAHGVAAYAELAGWHNEDVGLQDQPGLEIHVERRGEELAERVSFYIGAEQQRQFHHDSLVRPVRRWRHEGLAVAKELGDLLPRRLPIEPCADPAAWPDIGRREIPVRAIAQREVLLDVRRADPYGGAPRAMMRARARVHGEDLVAHTKRGLAPRLHLVRFW